MDQSAAPGDGDRRPASAAQLNERPRLERVIELATPSLVVDDWPGAHPPVIHIADPLAPSDQVALDPARRTMVVRFRADQAYQVHVAHVIGFLDQFGFEGIELIGAGLGAVVARLVARWCPHRVAELKLVEPLDVAEGESLFARSLRDCPPVRRE